MAGDSEKNCLSVPASAHPPAIGTVADQIAEGLGISPSYINLIERNQRPVTAQILEVRLRFPRTAFGNGRERLGVFVHGGGAVDDQGDVNGVGNFLGSGSRGLGRGVIAVGVGAFQHQGNGVSAIILNALLGPGRRVFEHILKGSKAGAGHSPVGSMSQTSMAIRGLLGIAPSKP